MATQRWPEQWLLTDERMNAELSGAIRRAAATGAGIIVRHHRSPPEQRRSIAAQVIAAGALLGISRDVELARELGAALVHNPTFAPGPLPFSLSVHDEAEALAAASSDAALVFVSPVFATRSHPGARALGIRGAQELARRSGHPAIALGGMDETRGKALIHAGFSGWAAIDRWLRI
jgi:thiamine-phosphate pyrophosphorylase